MEANASAPNASPFATLKALEHNLRRERRVFTMLIGLLVFAAVAAACVAITTIAFLSLAGDGAQLRATIAQSNEALSFRYNQLTSARLLLGLKEASLLVADDTPAAHAHCAPTFAGVDGSPPLRALCDRAIDAMSHASSDTPLLFVLVDGSAAYGYQLAPAAHLPDGPLRPGEGARVLVDSALLHMSARGADPLSVGRGRSVIWFRPPAALGFAPNLVLGATSVLKDGKPYALVLTSVDIATLGRDPDGNGPDVAPVLVDADGLRLAGPLSDGATQVIERYLASEPTGRFHLLPRFGWAMRERPLVHDFGHYLLALSWADHLRQIRAPVAVVLLLTVALVLMLLSLLRYWNRRVLARTYGEATRALENELLNHLLVHATPIGLCIVRKRDFDIVIANQIVRNVLGLDTRATRLPAALCLEFEKHLPAPVNEGTASTPIYALPFSLTRENGESVHLDITYAAATLNREAVMFCAFADMSKHYEAERLLREAQRTSDEAARTKVSFFAAMSHEIRTPLASLVGNIELVARGPLAAEQEARVDAMQVSAAELLQIVSDVLDFSKIDVGAMKLSEDAESIAALLVRIALAHAPLAVRQKLPFYLVMDRAIPARLFFDPIRLAQIVNNLLSNAFKFTHSGKIVLRAAWRDATLDISVADSGVGMPDDLKARLFQPFTQGDDHRLTESRGTGLGLTICGRLAALMHGRCEVESTLGVGTRVLVSLPLRADGAATAGEQWTLPDPHPALLCRAPENREWLTNLFDARLSTPVYLHATETPPDGAFDYLLVTGEFSVDDVQRVWRDPAKVVWLRQDGPLVPLALEGGGVEVSLYSLAGIRTATQMLRGQLPAADAAPTQTDTGAAGAEAHAPADFHRLSVLIAEDNLLNRSLLRDQLRTLGANVIEAKDGEEALAKLETAHVDLVITDLNMPKMNGYELLQTARAKQPSLPVYAVSGNALPEQIAQGRTLGFTDYLSKPVPLAALARVLTDVTSRVLADHAAAQPAQATPGTSPLSADNATGVDEQTPRFPDLPPGLAPIFIEQADHDLADFARIAGTQDVQRLREWVHRVAGGIAVLGPSVLHDTCRELRAAIHESGAWDENVQTLAAALIADLEALRAYAANREST
ncbi:hybrid sensor histidine kinase/response regulator [Paraburkholderia tropica]|uniref:hybrid sensor histidine kinase/response regulator n=1 Tax=Paraburkholderia tropica TaxID=92647 RepID=UPI002AB6EFF3|nr:ATP-binding protein [Paraburkholderia tropica]